jgi:hypothetical protein
MLCCIIISVLFAACAPSATVAPAAPKAPATAFTLSSAGPAAYQLNGIDDARHEFQGGENYEWWYMDASFDNGYSFVTAWHFMNAKISGILMPVRAIQFSVYDPQGKKMAATPAFMADKCNASKTSCDVTMGNNNLKGNYPRYDVEFHEGNMGCKLTFANLTQGYRNLPDGITYFSREPERYMGWAVAQPKAKVTGILIVDGKEIPVTGLGYHDHNWGNTMLNDIYSFWHWGRIMSGDYTFIYTVGESSKITGNKPVTGLITFKGHDLVDLSDKLNADFNDLALDKLTGINYPQAMVMRVESPNVKGTVTNNVKKLVESELLPGMKEGAGNGYLRFLSDCDIKLDVKGEKIVTDAPLIHEFIHF